MLLLHGHVLMRNDALFTTSASLPYDCIWCMHMQRERQCHWQGIRPCTGIKSVATYRLMIRRASKLWYSASFGGWP